MSQHSQLIHAVDHLVDQTLNATMAFVFVYLNILVIHTLAVDQNAYLVQIAQPTRHAYETDVSILVRVRVDTIVYAM